MGQPGPMQAGEYTPPTPPNYVTFDLKNAPPPSALYLQRDDTLELLAQSRTTTEIVTILGRFLRSDGIIIPFAQAYKITDAGNNVMGFNLVLGEGWLLGCSAIATVAQQRGETFVQFCITRGFNPNSPKANIVQTFLADYITKNRLTSWPGGRILDSREGPGQMETNLFPASPGAGVDLGLTVAMQNNAMRPYYLVATLVTSAAVANRQVQITFDANAAHQWPGAPAAQVASTTVTYCFCRGTTQYTDARGLVVVPMPDVYLGTSLGPTVWATLTTNLQAGDAWTTLAALAEIWRIA